MNYESEKGYLLWLRNRYIEELKMLKRKLREPKTVTFRTKVKEIDKMGNIFHRSLNHRDGRSAPGRAEPHGQLRCKLINNEWWKITKEIN